MQAFSNDELLRISRGQATTNELIAILDDGSMDLLHSREMAERFPNTYVAAFAGRFIGASREILTLIELIRGQSIPPTLAAVHYIAVSDETMDI